MSTGDSGRTVHAKSVDGSYEALEVQTVNDHALLYTWQGSENHLRPLLLMAHSDVSAITLLNIGLAH